MYNRDYKLIIRFEQSPDSASRSPLGLRRMLGKLGSRGRINNNIGVYLYDQLYVE